ncbi:MAG: excinuclease ABC subunit UvrC [Rickettsiaceae bacterium]|nr:excinuclease ABC subunit UvrC [Rickettsiaceae bacterium]
MSDLNQLVTKLPSLPGVYKFLSPKGEVLYVGKAKNLKQRVSYYIRPDLELRLKKMVSFAEKIEHIVTQSESEALLLEARLIKHHQPKFNILLKDDKSFPYVVLKANHPFPYVIKQRSKTVPEGLAFGPFASNADVDATLSELQKIFKLRSCSDNYFSTRKRPCLQYQIKRCHAPCVDKISKEDYDELVSEVENFLSGKTKQLQEHLSAKMEILSADMKYEEAAKIRDRIKALSYVQMKFGSFSDILKDADVISMQRDGDISAILVAIYRNGQYYGNHIYFVEGTSDSSDSEIITGFLDQFYQNKEVPSEILLSHEVSSSDFENWHSGVKISHPIKGAKSQIIKSFDDSLSKSLHEKMKGKIKQNQIFSEICSIFGLQNTPEIIEIYDNSHIMGKYAVGAMVVASREGFLKKRYRCYNLESTSETGGDDYGMLAEVMRRRLEKIIKDPGSKPTLMIIDGGRGHMSTVQSVMNKMNCFIPFVCMSKGPDRNAGVEQFHMVGRDVFTISKDEKVMKYLQILRDEAHNFAIKSHRKRRSKSIRSSTLDDIDGIGEKRKKDLLHSFGSVEAIKNASVEELENIQTIGKSTARKIFLALHKDSL